MPDDELTIEALQRLNDVCDDFELRLRTNQQPRIEALLDTVDERERPALLAQLLDVELYYQHSAGQLPPCAQLLGRFPTYADVVTRVFRRYLADDPDATKESTYDESAPATPRFAPGTRLGRYRIEQRLGAGAFGEVYLAYDDAGQPFAIKTLHRRPQSARRTTDFVAEARHLHQVVQRSRRRGFAGVHEIDLSDPQWPFVVMEYVDGQSLRSLIDARRLSLAAAVELLAKVADAVDEMHRCGIYHRDLKPSNVLVDAAGEPWVVDFGLAIHESQQRGHAGQLAGTLSYMSPEQVRGDVHRIDGRADVWALGAVLYELLAGRQPFQGSYREELIEEIRYRDPRPPRQIEGGERIPAELEAICLRALAKEPSDRYSTARDLADALRDVLDRGLLAATPETQRSWQGYFETRLADDANRWRERPGIRRLPGPIDALGIALLARRRPWTKPQRAMMASAARFYLLGLIALVFVTLTALPVAREIARQTRNRRTQRLVAQLAQTRLDQASATPAVESMVAQLQLDRPTAEPLLRDALAAAQAQRDGEAEFIYRAALIPFDSRQLDHLLHSLLETDDEEVLAQWPPLLAWEFVDRDRLAALCRAELERPSTTPAGRYLYWPECEPALRDKIAAADGVVAERFAFCQALPLDDWEDVVQRLAEARYKPHSKSMYRSGDERFVAAVWLRNGNSGAAEDTAGEPPSDSLTRRVSVDRSLLQTPLPPSDEQSSTPAGAQHRSANPLSRPVHLEEARPDFFADIPGLYKVDLYWSPYSTTMRNLCANQMAFAQQLLRQQPGNSAAAFLLGRAEYSRGHDTAAIGWLTQAMESDDCVPFALPYRLRAHAALGEVEAARADLEQFRQLLEASPADPTWREAYLTSLDAAVAIAEGHEEAAVEALENMVRDLASKKPRSVLFYAASGYASLAGSLAAEQPARAEPFARRSVELIGQSLAQGMPAPEILAMREFDGLRGRDDLEQLLPDFLPMYRGHWMDDGAEIVFHRGAASDRHLANCRIAMARGFEPSSISALPADSADQTLFCSVWRKKPWREADDRQTCRWANAAAVLLSIDHDPQARRLLADSPHPALKTRLQQRLDAFGIAHDRGERDDQPRPE